MFDAIAKKPRKFILCVNPRSGVHQDLFCYICILKLENQSKLYVQVMFIPGALSLSPSPTGMPANNYIVPLLSPFSPATDEKSNIYYDSRGL